jgi:hypothetical protein
MVSIIGGIVNIMMAILTIIGVVSGAAFAWTFLAILVTVLLVSED